MDKKINEIQNFILAGFSIFYGISLAINAICALAGTAELAVWHWGPFFIVASLSWHNLPEEARARLIQYAKTYTRVCKQLARRVASMVFVVIKRALSSLPALLSSNWKNRTPERERCNL